MIGAQGELTAILVRGVVTQAFRSHGLDLTDDWIDRFTELTIDLQPSLRLSFEDVADGLALGARKWWPDE